MFLGRGGRAQTVAPQNRLHAIAETPDFLWVVPQGARTLLTQSVGFSPFRGLLTFPWVFHRGSGGQSPASLSIASAISGRGE